MPFIADDQNEEKKQQEQGAAGSAPGAPAAGNATVLGGGQSGTIGGGSTTAPAGPKAAKPSSSGSFVNLKNYLDVNASRADEMGQRVEDHANEQVQDADARIGGLRDTAQQDITTNTVTDERGATGAYTHAAQNPTDSLLATNLSTYDDDFGTLWNATYGGKGGLSEFEGATDAQTAVNNVVQTGRLAQDFAGQQTLMKDTYANNGRQYDRGGGILDTYLVGGGTDAFGNVAAQGDAYKDTYTNLQDWFNDARAEGVATTDATRDAFRDAVTGYGTQLDDVLSGSLATRDARNTEQDALVKAARGGDESALKQLGFDDMTVAYLMAHPEDRAGFIGNATQVGAGSVADAGLVSRYADLLKLTGGDASYLGAIDNEGRVGPSGEFADMSEGGYNADTSGAQSYAVQANTQDATARINTGTIRPASLIKAGGPQAPGVVNLALQYGVDMTPFVHPDPSSPLGWRLDTTSLMPIVNSAISSSGAGSPFADSGAYDANLDEQIAMQEATPIVGSHEDGYISPMEVGAAEDDPSAWLPALGAYVQPETPTPSPSGGDMTDEEKDTFFS